MAQTKRFTNIKELEKFEGKALANRQMTVAESKVNDILQTNFPNDWKWVGNGAFWIEGKNPDFINTNSLKAVIEVDGCEEWKRKDYGGNDMYAQSRIEHFGKYGFRCLIINYKQKTDEIVGQIRSLQKD